MRPLLIAFAALVLALAGSPVGAHGDYPHGDRAPLAVHGGLRHADGTTVGEHGKRPGTIAHAAISPETAPTAETHRAPHESASVVEPASCPDHDGGPCCCGADRCAGSPDPRPIADAFALPTLATPPTQRAIDTFGATTVAQLRVPGPLGARAPPPAR